MLGPLVLVVLFSFGSNALIGFPMGDLTLAWYGQLIADEGFRDAPASASSSRPASRSSPP